MPQDSAVPYMYGVFGLIVKVKADLYWDIQITWFPSVNWPSMLACKDTTIGYPADFPFLLLILALWWMTIILSEISLDIIQSERKLSLFHLSR